jgi:hypothetical protein
MRFTQWFSGRAEHEVPEEDEGLEAPPGFPDDAGLDGFPGHSSPARVGYGVAFLYRAEPRSLDDAGTIVDCMKEGHPVVVNMEQADTAEAQRIRDFLRGAAYALNGEVRKVAARVYACVPRSYQFQRIATPSEQAASTPPSLSSDEQSRDSDASW